MLKAFVKQIGVSGDEICIQVSFVTNKTNLDHHDTPLT